MKFSVGYSVQNSEILVDAILRAKNEISEVYFSFGKMPSGRNDQTRASGMTPWEAQEKQLEDLSRLHREGLKFNLLFNANCYGDRAQSRAFFCEVGEIIEYVGGRFSLSSVTTTSPLVAKFIKQNFGGIDVRASVNMSIGSALGMEYLAQNFDSFYIKREYNRDFNTLKNLRAWCNENGKEMYLLANSGCLNDCSAHTFHDNLVAHESEIAAIDNGYQFSGVCREYLSKNKNGETILAATNFIRPEDTALYEGLVPAMKLATRVHENPVRIIRAYTERRSFAGDALSLLEPNHSGMMYPYILENGLIDSNVENGKLIYSNGENAIIRLEENYAYQQND